MATACSDPPEGRARWTLALLSDAMVKLTEHESLSYETLRRRLAENGLKPWREDMWCIPKVDAGFVAAMEDVLDLYSETRDPKRPVICFDESPTQLIGEVRAPIPAEPGRCERFDFEYRRKGGATAQRQRRPHRMDVHNRQCQHQDGPSISPNKQNHHASHQRGITSVKRH